jgi:hypothetical protein
MWLTAEGSAFGFLRIGATPPGGLASGLLIIDDPAVDTRGGGESLGGEMMR